MTRKLHRLPGMLLERPLSDNLGRCLPLQGGDALNYGNFSHNVSSQILSHGESEEFMEK